MVVEIVSTLFGLVLAAAFLFGTSWGRSVLRGFAAEERPLRAALGFGVMVAGLLIAWDHVVGGGVDTIQLVDGLVFGAGLGAIVYVAGRRVRRPANEG